MNDVIHFYKVDDLENVKNLYEGILELSLYKDQGKCLIYHLNGYGKVGFCTHHPSKKNDTTCITFIYATTKQVDAIYEKLKSHGLGIEEPSINPNFNIYHFFVKVYEGHTLEFQAFLK